MSFSGQRVGFTPSPSDAALLQRVLLSLLVVFCCVHVGSKGKSHGKMSLADVYSKQVREIILKKERKKSTICINENMSDPPAQ